MLGRKDRIAGTGIEGQTAGRFGAGTGVEVVSTMGRKGGRSSIGASLDRLATWLRLAGWRSFARMGCHWERRCLCHSLRPHEVPVVVDSDKVGLRGVAFPLDTLVPASALSGAGIERGKTIRRTGFEVIRRPFTMGGVEPLPYGPCGPGPGP